MTDSSRKSLDGGANKIVDRRSFLQSVGIETGFLALSGENQVRSRVSKPCPPLRDKPLQSVASLPTDSTRPWIGPEFWSNRLQDWQLNAGRIECTTGDVHREARTVSLLTRELVDEHASGHLSVRTGIAGDADKNGFCGFLLGVGEGKLDYRAAALAQRGSGTGGGFFCAFNRDGSIQFREHTSETRPLRFAELPSQKVYPEGTPIPQESGREYRLDVDILPRTDEQCDVHFSVRDAETGQCLAHASRRMEQSLLRGGIALVSSPPKGDHGARWWFEDVRTGGKKIGEFPDRTFGPIAGTLYSVNEDVLRLTAQLMPIADKERTVRFQYRERGGTGDWQEAPTVTVGQGYTAFFRVENWDSTREWTYRIVSEDEQQRTSTYTGKIRADPGDDASELTVGLFSCILSVARQLETGNGQLTLPRANSIGRYTPANMYFPHDELAKNTLAHDPDILAFVGDQLYQNNPTKISGRKMPLLDYLYKWYQWVWSFRDLTRNRPTIVHADDHDVYQSNLWGDKGEKVSSHRVRRGGYSHTGSFVNVVEATQCRHNPDPYDPEPIRRDIRVYYTMFRYGGVDFAILEDRKFKTGPKDDDLLKTKQLIGERQATFLKEWARKRDSNRAGICTSGTIFAAANTTPAGAPFKNFDTGAYPKAARNKTIRLLRNADTVVLSGDQHLPTLMRQGLETHTDGVLQFCGPAGATLYQRWFEPKKVLSNGSGEPNTGDFTDAFDHKIRMLAVANPKISYERFMKLAGTKRAYIGDRQLKREGYGIVHVDNEANEVTLECWPWNVDPTSSGAGQFPGWPYHVSFDEITHR